MAAILVVDDRPVNREFLVSLLAYAGHETYTAGDGLEGLKLAEQITPDLVITDVLMPTMDGVEFTRRLKAVPRLAQVPVIFYTATYRLPEARSIAESCGVSCVLAKPAEPQEILDIVHRELGISQAPPTPPSQYLLPTGRYRSLAADRLLTSTVHELSGIQEQIRSTMELDDTPSAKARQLENISFGLDESLRRAQALSMRLAALIELGLDLASLREVRPMLEMFCHASQDILNAKIVAVCAVDENGAVLEFVIRGVDAEEAEEVAAGLDPTAGWIGRVALAGLPRRLGGEAATSALGLPQGHPPVSSIVAVPLESSGRSFGWFYAAEKLGGEFNDEDEQLASTLVSQLLPAYENALLVDRLRRHSGMLEFEAEERRQALMELRESEGRFRQLAESIREVFFLVDVRAGTLLYISPAYEEIFGQDQETLYNRPTAFLDTIHPEDRFTVLRHFAAARRSGSFQLRCRIGAGSSMRWIRAQSFPVLDNDGQLARIAGIAEDVTAAELQDRRIKRLSRIQAVLSGINAAIVRIHERSSLLDEAVRIAIEHGGFAVAWIGLVQPEAMRIEFVAYRGANPKIADSVSNALVDEVVTGAGMSAQTLRMKRHLVLNDLNTVQKPGRALRLALDHGYTSAIVLPLMPDAIPAGVLVLFANETGFFDEREIMLLDELAGDISFALEYISREERIHYLAYYDSLTDLPNTTLFYEHLSKMLEHSPDSHAALFLIDIDRFTHLNDTLGRHVGDQLLESIAKRIKSGLSIRANVARIGSDTFAIAVPGLANDSAAGFILQGEIFAIFSAPFDLNDQELQVSARAGIAIAPTDGDTPDMLFRNAEAALKEAKTSGARYLFYSSDLNARIADDLALEQELARAVANREFEVYYQPKVDSVSGGIIGLEALLRWNSPSRGLVSPDTFIPSLESSDLIVEVGQWVLEQTLSDRKNWEQKGLDPPPIAVNVSPQQLRHDDFAETVLITLQRFGTPGHALELEITETLIMADIEAKIRQLETLSNAGVTIAVDDFGTGYSSLHYLARLPVDSLKIDRSFIVSMTEDADSMTLVSTIINLARSFSLKAIAEGVDSEEQAKFLRLLKCDSMQGYLFGRPQPSEEIERLLESRDQG